MVNIWQDIGATFTMKMRISGGSKKIEGDDETLLNYK
jgi:hypothetical protein